MINSIFITGTDTSIGKTTVAVSLLKSFDLHGLTAVGLKPISSGCQYNKSGQLVNDDALSLQAASSIQCPYRVINPIALAEPIAPHIAAQQVNIKLSVKETVEKIVTAMQETKADIHVIEGVGGWSVPLNDHEFMADVVSTLNIPTILVVGMKLGCLNHAMLTSQSIINTKTPLVGWIANCIDPSMLAIQENINTLKQSIPAPYLGIMPYGSVSQVDVIDMDCVMALLT